MSSFLKIHNVGELESACLSVLNEALIKRDVATQPIGLASRFELERNKRAEASVRLVNGVPQYRCSSGMLLAILDLSMHISSDFRFHTTVRPTTDEVIVGGVSKKDRFISYPLLEAEDWAGNALGVVPECPERQYLGWYLFTFAMRFLSLHEQGHYLYGHVHLRPTLFISETLRTVRSSPRLRAIEAEADSFALQNVILFGTERWKSTSERVDKVIKCPSDWAVMSFLGGLIVAFVFCASSPEPTLPTKTHPSYSCRIYNFLNIWSGLRHRIDPVGNDWSNANEIAFQGMNSALQVLPETIGSLLAEEIKGMLEGRGTHAKAELLEYVEILGALFPRLRKVREKMEADIGGPLLED